MAPVLVACLERFLDEQAAEAAAVDEQIGSDQLPTVEGDRLDESVLRVDRDTAHLALDPLYAAGLRKSAQVTREAGGIEMQGIRNLVQRRVRRVDRARKPTFGRRHGLDRIVLERGAPRRRGTS